MTPGCECGAERPCLMPFLDTPDEDWRAFWREHPARRGIGRLERADPGRRIYGPGRMHDCEHGKVRALCERCTAPLEVS